MPKLVIANKRYSSWSLRAWLVARHFAIPFEEVMIDLAASTMKADILKWSPSGRVPCLIDGEACVWETLAIVEWLAETHPELAIWPRDRLARAHARAISSEMHAGFLALRSTCPMNLRRTFAWKDRGAATAADVARIEALIAEARARFGAGGPFLYGEFSAADAMYAPVAVRLAGYSWPVSPVTGAWVEAIHALPAFRDWKAGADVETSIVGDDEIADEA
ncbi:MAG: glutathione S-transferase family protein [Phyllobacteriaceae bacterium]|nr:glutathione S-transferase family protein [Phyllobacteriaceae bacterium]